MAVTLHFSFTLSGSQLNTPGRIKGAIQGLIPTPAPADLKIEVISESGIRVTYSHDFTDADAAEAAARKALNTELPT